VSRYSAAQAVDRLGEGKKSESYFAKLVTVAEKADGDRPAEDISGEEAKSFWIEDPLFPSPVETRW
jgi:hypothetical protein